MVIEALGPQTGELLRRIYDTGRVFYTTAPFGGP